MLTKDKIEKDFIDAYKSREELKISVLRLIKSAIKNAEISKKGELTKDDVIAVLRREAKQRKDSIEEFKKLNKHEAMEQEKMELSIIEPYLPSQLDEAQTREIVQETIKELHIENETQIGRLIGSVMSKHGSNVDGSLVSKIAREVLNQKQK